MLIGTAVVGATTMIFSIIVVLTDGLTQNLEKLSMLHPPFLLGLITGGAMIYWFTGASMQAVTTGAYRAVEFIKANIRLDGVEKASVADSKKVVEICTQYAQKGMFNIFLAVFFAHAGVRVPRALLLHRLPDLDRAVRPVPGDLHGQRRRRLGQREENRRGGAEGEGHRRSTPRRWSATRSGDPFKDTSSVAMNPVIKFTTLFGLLAVELGVQLAEQYGSRTEPAACRGAVLRRVGGVRVAVVLRMRIVGSAPEVCRGRTNL